MPLKKNIFTFLIIGILGVLLHFLYDWTNENAFVGIFSAVNESIWEHQKLLFFSVLFYSIFEYFKVKNTISNYIIATAIGILFGILSVITSFYTYSGILGFSITFIDISLYFLGVFVFLFIRNIIIKNKFYVSRKAEITGIVILSLLFIVFTVFTFYPPKISIFIPDLSSSKG